MQLFFYISLIIAFFDFLFKCYGIIWAKLRVKQSKNNTKFSKVRALVELPFAFIKKLMKYTETKYLGLHKNSQHVFLIAAAYNLRRMPKLIQRYE